MKQILLSPGLVHRDINVYSHIEQKKINNKFLRTGKAVITMLKVAYDPEMPVNVYDPGLTYKVDIDREKNVCIDMTLTVPNCPAADFILEDVRMKIEAVDGVNSIEVNLVFEPEWDKDVMMEEAKLELDLLRKYISSQTRI